MDGGNLGAPPNPPRCGVVLPGEPEQRRGQLLLAGRPAVAVGDLPPGQIPHDLPGDLGDLVPPVGPGAAHALQDLPEAGHALAGRGREVGAEVEGLGVRGEEHGHGPAALAGGGLHGLHVDGVDVGALLAVDLDADEVLVEVVGGLLVLEGLVRHDVAPVAAAVADAQQHRHVRASGPPRRPRPTRATSRRGCRRAGGGRGRSRGPVGSAWGPSCRSTRQVGRQASPGRRRRVVPLIGVPRPLAPKRRRQHT